MYFLTPCCRSKEHFPLSSAVRNRISRITRKVYGRRGSSCRESPRPPGLGRHIGDTEHRASMTPVSLDKSTRDIHFDGRTLFTAGELEPAGVLDEELVMVEELNDKDGSRLFGPAKGKKGRGCIEFRQLGWYQEPSPAGRQPL